MLTSLVLALVAHSQKPLPPHVRAMIADSTLPHVAEPSGLGDADWARKPRIGMGNQPKGWKAFIFWGQVYVAKGTEPPADVRVEIRYPQAYLLSKKPESGTGSPTPSRSGEPPTERILPTTPAFPRTFGQKAPTRYRSPSKRATTITFGRPPGGSRSTPMTPAGVVSAVQCRLIPAVSGGKVPSRTNLMMSVGADYWEALDSNWDQWKTNGDVAIGRFDWIKPKWNWHSMCSLSEAELRQLSQLPPAPTDKMYR